MTSTATPSQPGSRTLRGLIAVSLLTAVAVTLQFGWITVLVQSDDPAATAVRDWVQFPRTGKRIVEGRTDEIYVRDFTPDAREEFEDGFFFLYPPFAAWVTVPLAGLPPLTAYVACVLVVAGVTLASVVLLLLVLGRSTGQRVLGVLAALASAPWYIAVVLGHFSALLLTGPALALAAWQRNRPAVTGAALAVLLTKPNWGLPILGVLVVGRRWRMVGGFVLVGVLLIGVSLPLGPELWGDWIATMSGYRGYITDRTAPWKQATLFASLQSLLGLPGSNVRVYAPWLALSAVAAAALLLCWWRLGRERRWFPRLLGVTLLAVLMTTPYAHFYDALLLAPPAAVLWLSPSSYRSRRWRRLALGASVAVYVWMFVQYFVLQARAPSLTGMGLALWLTTEMVDLLPGRPGHVGHADVATD